MPETPAPDASLPRGGQLRQYLGKVLANRLQNTRLVSSLDESALLSPLLPEQHWAHEIVSRRVLFWAAEEDSKASENGDERSTGIPAYSVPRVLLPLSEPTQTFEPSRISAPEGHVEIVAVVSRDLLDIPSYASLLVPRTCSVYDLPDVLSTFANSVGSATLGADAVPRTHLPFHRALAGDSAPGAGSRAQELRQLARAAERQRERKQMLSVVGQLQYHSRRATTAGTRGPPSSQDVVDPSPSTGGETRAASEADAAGGPRGYQSLISLEEGMLSEYPLLRAAGSGDALCPNIFAPTAPGDRVFAITDLSLSPEFLDGQKSLLLEISSLLSSLQEQLKAAQSRRRVRVVFLIESPSPELTAARLRTLCRERLEHERRERERSALGSGDEIDLTVNAADVAEAKGASGSAGAERGRAKATPLEAALFGARAPGSATRGLTKAASSSSGAASSGSRAPSSQRLSRQQLSFFRASSARLGGASTSAAPSRQRTLLECISKPRNDSRGCPVMPGAADPPVKRLAQGAAGGAVPVSSECVSPTPSASLSSSSMLPPSNSPHTLPVHPSPRWASLVAPLCSKNQLWQSFLDENLFASARRGAAGRRKKSAGSRISGSAGNAGNAQLPGSGLASTLSNAPRLPLPIRRIFLIPDAPESRSAHLEWMRTISGLTEPYLSNWRLHACAVASEDSSYSQACRAFYSLAHNSPFSCSGEGVSDAAGAFLLSWADANPLEAFAGVSSTKPSLPLPPDATENFFWGAGP